MQLTRHTPAQLTRHTPAQLTRHTPAQLTLAQLTLAQLATHTSHSRATHATHTSYSRATHTVTFPVAEASGRRGCAVTLTVSIHTLRWVYFAVSSEQGQNSLREVT
jgi:hypothetical protein